MTRRKKVVFVCEHGAAKSVIAREHFVRLARARGLRVDAIARGTDPDPEIPESVLRGLREDGFDVMQSAPRGLVTGDLQSAMLIVSFDADVSSIVGDEIRREKWDGLPSVKADYSSGKVPIIDLVEQLVDRLDNVSAAP